MLTLTPRQRQIAFYGLAGAAALVLLVAILAIVLAVRSPGVWLGVCLGVLVLIIVAEIVLLLMDKPEPPHDPQPRRGPSAQPPRDSDVEFEL